MSAKKSLSFSVGVLAGVTVAAYAMVARPWHLRWGATAAEATRALPGDEFVPAPASQSTRAVTISAPPSRIWPWLAQMGQGRGGFNSYDWLENLIGLDIHSAEAIIPELQTLRPGDLIRTDRGGGFTAAIVEPYRVLALRARLNLAGRHLPFDAPVTGTVLDTSWTFVIDPLDDESTRLTARFRAAYESSAVTEAFVRGVLEPAVFVMERKMLLTVKERAELLAHGNGLVHA
jgi:hypothetical protein